MPTRIIPLVLDDRVKADNNSAFILNISGTEAVTFYSTAQKYRRSRMKAVFVLQCSGIDAVEDSTYTFTVRSPFPLDDGDPTNAPNISLQTLGAPTFNTGGFASIDDVTTWPLSGDITPAPSFTLFDGTVPAWVFIVTISPAGEEGTFDYSARITVDFSHSIT